MYKNVHSSTVASSQKLNTTQNTHPFQISHGILIIESHTTKSRQATIIYSNVDESHKCAIERKKPDTKDFI